MSKFPLKSKLVSQVEIRLALKRIAKHEEELRRLDGILQKCMEICAMAQGHMQEHIRKQDDEIPANTVANDKNQQFEKVCREAGFTSYRQAALFFYEAKNELQDLLDE